MQLTAHFSLTEFTRSDMASRLHIDNTPPPEAVENLRALCTEVLEPLRQHFNVPIAISSGYRSPPLNKAVGGAPSSQHQHGEAADIHIPDYATGLKWFSWLKDHCPYDCLIKERASPTAKTFWIHVSHRRTGKQRKRAIYDMIKNP